mmetsp:Transcript_9520/g.23833  ORF Transcript_9520/g.23833 Transcript_9520/m.23833 type:complete len:418 (+) Transcript_9520:25-1278(+)
MAIKMVPAGSTPNMPGARAYSHSSKAGLRPNCVCVCGGVSGIQAARVAREHGRALDGADVQEQHGHTLQANAAARVRGRAEAERVHVRADAVQAHALFLRAGPQHLGVVHALRARADLLPTHEQVIRVGVLAVYRVAHGVERAHAVRVLVQHEEVGAVLLLHQLAQPALQRRAQVIVVANLLARVAQHLHAFRESQAGDGGVHQVLKRVLPLDGCDLHRVALLQTIENEQQHAFQHVQGFMVVLVNGHLQVKPSELCQMAMGERLLGTEHRPNLENTLHVRADGHLLEELGRLREVRFSIKVLDFKDLGTTLRRACDHLRCVNLSKTLAAQEFTEELADARLHAEDSLVGGCAQVDDAVVKASRLPQDHKLVRCLLVLLQLLDLLLQLTFVALSCGSKLCLRLFNQSLDALQLLLLR